MDDPMFKADTHINTCAVLSTLGRHDVALNHAYSAIMIIQASLLMAFLPDRKENDHLHGSNHQKIKDLKKDKTSDILNDFKDRISILAVSYHSLGVE